MKHRPSFGNIVEIIYVHNKYWLNGLFGSNDFTYTPKIVDTVLMSLFMRVNSKYHTSHAPCIGLSGILFAVESN